MARTFRRRHYFLESPPYQRSFKVAGYFTTYDLVRFDNPLSIHHNQWLSVYRPMTPREKADHLRDAHGESKNMEVRSPGFYYRKYRKQSHRTREREELLRWMKAPNDYDPVFYPDPPSCWWDWS